MESNINESKHAQYNAKAYININKLFGGIYVCRREKNKNRTDGKR